MIIKQGLLPNQVLQRARNGMATAIVSGETTQTGKVFANVRGLRGWKSKSVGTAKRGKFTARLTGLPTGGPYRVELNCGAESVAVDGIRVGDVWLLAGQSNMQGTGDLATALRRSSGVFACTMGGVWGEAEEPVHLLEESPDPVHSAKQATPEEAARMRREATGGAGPALSFATELFRRTGVPQGLIPSAHGGTSLTQWSPALKPGGGKSLYGSMLRAWRATGQPVKGMLWYQGESDANEKEAPTYTERFVQFVRAVRRDLKQPQLPVLTVQLGRVINPTDTSDRFWNSVQEQQLKMPSRLAGVGVVAAVDLPLSDPIHISGEGQRRLGVRLARLAARMIYGDRSESPPPVILGAHRLRAKGGKSHEMLYEIRCKNVVGALRGNPEHAVKLVDRDHKFVDAVFRVRADGDRLLVNVWPASMKPGLRLIYGHGCNPAAMLTDDRDLALPVSGPIVFDNEFACGPVEMNWAGGDTVHALNLQKLTAKAATDLACKEPLRNHLGPWSWWPIFVNLHEKWAGRSGVACCTTEVEVKSSARLLIGAGYDGPIRIWLDDREIHNNPKGTNPIVADEAVVPVRFAAGKHRLTVAMDTNGGKAWGFTLRWLHADGNADPVKLVWPTPVS